MGYFCIIFSKLVGEGERGGGEGKEVRVEEQGGRGEGEGIYSSFEIDSPEKNADFTLPPLFSKFSPKKIELGEKRTNPSRVGK